MSDAATRAAERWAGRLPPTGEPPYDGDMEARLRSLETILPTLATRSDMAELRADTKTSIADLRADMHEMNAGISRWMLTTVLAIIGTVVLGFAGLFFNLTSALKPPAATSAQQAPIIINVPGPAPQQPTPSGK